jgi:hypothetical protein
MPRLVVLALLGLAALVVAGDVASAASGIRPLAPARGAIVPKGKPVEFRMRVRGRGQVWVRVCRSSARNRGGLICPDESFGRATRRAGIFRYRPKLYEFPRFWLNRPGTYYWQAHRIACDRRGRDCRQPGPVTEFTVQ